MMNILIYFCLNPLRKLLNHRWDTPLKDIFAAATSDTIDKAITIKLRILKVDVTGQTGPLLQFLHQLLSSK